MNVRFQDFNPWKFSFRDDPVLVLEDFWSPEEMARFRKAMTKSQWTSLSNLPLVARAFPNCGNWLKATIGPQEAEYFLGRVGLPCVAAYVESFPGIRARHVNFNYYAYAVGDCLSTHDDTDEAYVASQGIRPPRRRLALATYFHEEWHPDWGGELIIYADKARKGGQRHLSITHCILPAPGSLVIFTVPRFHRVCRVDLLAGDRKRLSIAGWFMTEHDS
ncbi:MAG: hypothetical protein D6690_03815 [Nitrospirae bacterium]|nr:MAG: hypothetical protein D6690_03815 [Nitrospirota bacterium]